jgi:hypothetical protein
VGAVLTTALALVALPGFAASRTPAAPSFDPAALQSVTVPARIAAVVEFGSPDPGRRSAGFVDPDAAFLEPPAEAAQIPERPVIEQPGARSVAVEKPPRYTLSGIATFYDHGTTAMRLPRGTRVVICGAGGCIERRITDYGPNAAAYPERIADLYRPDFFRICGCPWYAGTTRVTVRVY